MANYEYSAISLYVNNIHQHTDTLRELILYVEALKYKIEKYIGPDGSYEINMIEFPENFNQTLIERNHLYYHVEFGPSNIPQDKRQTQFNIDSNDRAYIFIPHSSKRALNTTLELYEWLYANFAGEDLIQMSVIFGDESQDYSELIPKIIYSKPVVQSTNDGGF